MRLCGCQMEEEACDAAGKAGLLKVAFEAAIDEKLPEGCHCKKGELERPLSHGEYCMCLESAVDQLGLSLQSTRERFNKRESEMAEEAGVNTADSVLSCVCSKYQKFENVFEHEQNGQWTVINSHGAAVQCPSSLVSAASCTSVIASVESLPLEILLKIFSFLLPVELCRHVSQVCKQWLTLAYDHSLWHTLDLSRPHMRVSGFDVCKIVLRVGRSVHHLNLHGLDELSPTEMAVIAENCPELTHLDLGFVSGVNRIMIHSILISCPKLECVNVEGCRDVHHEFVRGMVAVPGVVLCRLNFSHCPLVDDSLQLLSSTLPKIMALNIDGISWISNRTIQDLTDRHSDWLEELELDGAELTDYAVMALVRCGKLSSLSISFCELLSDISLQHIQTLPSLRKLCLRKGTMFTARGLTRFLSSPSLAALSYLDVSECANLNDDGIKTLIKCCGHSLKMLNLSWCWDATDTGLIAIVDGCSTLVHLYLVGLHRLTGSCLDRVPDDMPKLKYLDLQQCNFIQDLLIEDVVRRKPDLVVINYYGEKFVYEGVD